MSESAAVREQARSLYLKHRAAVELIYENRPDYAHEGKAMFRAAIEGQDTWVLDRDGTRAPFLPIRRLGSF